MRSVISIAVGSSFKGFVAISGYRATEELLV